MKKKKEKISFSGFQARQMREMLVDMLLRNPELFEQLPGITAEQREAYERERRRIKSPVGNEPMTVNVTMYIGAYDKGHQRQGYRDVLNIEYAIMRRFRVCPRFGQACTVQGEIKGKMSKDDYHPYYFGAVEMVVTVANPTPARDPETEAMI